MKRFKLFFYLVFFLLVPIVIWADPVKHRPLRIAVVEFETQGNIGIKDAGRIIAEWLITDLGRFHYYTLQERALLRKVLKEQKLEVSGMVDEKTASAIGKLYGVDAIITGSVIRWGDMVSITARIINTGTGTILKTAEVKSYDINDIPSLINRLAEKLLIRPELNREFVLKIPNGLKFFLNMDSINGSEVDDSISGVQCYGNDLKKQRNGGFLFNCKDSYVDCGTPNLFKRGTFTLAAWVKITKVPDRSMTIVGKDGVFSLDIDEEGKPVFIVYGVDSVESKKKLEKNQWYFIVATYKDNILKIYVNGVLQESFKAKGKLLSSSSHLVLGDWSEKTGDKAFCGVIDDVRIYDRVLNQHEINLIYSGGRSKPGMRSTGL